MSESLARFHRQTSVLTFIDAAFASTTSTTGADGEQEQAHGQSHVRGTSSGNVQGLLNVTIPPPSASKSKRREGREGREKTDRPERPERRSSRPAQEEDDSHLDYDYVAPPVSTSKGPPAVAYAPVPAAVEEPVPSEADFPELPKLPRVRPAEVERNPVRAVGEGKQGGAMEVEGVNDEEEEEDLDDNVVFKSAFVRSQHVSVDDLLPLHQHQHHSNSNGLQQGQVQGHKEGGSQLDALLAQASGVGSTHSSFYLSGSSAPLSSSLLGQGLSLPGANNPTADRDLYGDLGMGLDLDMDLSKLVQEQERQSPLEPGGAGLPASALWPPSSATGENKLAALFGSDSLLGGDYWSAAPLPPLPQPHASFGHAFSGTQSFAATAGSSMSGGGGRERSSWTFAQEDPFTAHTGGFTAHSAPSMQMQIPTHMPGAQPMQGQAPTPAYYFPPPQAAPTVPAGLSSLSSAAPFGGLFADQGTGTQHSSQQSLQSLGHIQGQGQGQSQHSSFGFAQGPQGGAGPSSTAVWSPPGLGGGLLGQTAGASASPAGPPGLFGAQLRNHSQPQRQQVRTPPPRPPGLG